MFSHVSRMLPYPLSKNSPYFPLFKKQNNKVKQWKISFDSKSGDNVELLLFLFAQLWQWRNRGRLHNGPTLSFQQIQFEILTNIKYYQKYSLSLQVLTTRNKFKRGKKGQLHECSNNMLDPQIVCNPILQQQHILSETFLQIFPLKFQQVKWN